MKKKKKILIIVPWFIEGVAGAQRVVISLLNNFPEDIFDIHVAVVVGFAVDPKQIKKNFRSEIKVNIVLALRDKISFWGIRKEIRNFNPDIIIANVLLTATNTVLAKFFAHSKAKIFIVNHGMDFSRPIHIIQTYFNYFFSKKNIVVSTGLKDFMVKKLKLRPEKIMVIHNPFNLKEIRKKAEDPILKNEVTWNRNKKSIVYVGRLEERTKNLTMVLLAFAEIKKKADVNFLLVGNGEEKKIFKKFAERLRISKNVFFLGWKENPYPYIKMSDALVLSSRAEGLPTVIIEALILGIPIISTDCLGGPSEILEGGKYGKLVPVGDYKAFARAVLETLESPPNPDFLKKRAEDFSYEKIVTQYLKVINEVLK